MSRPHLSRRQRLIARLAFFVLIIVVFVVAVQGRWEQVRDSTEKLSILNLVLAALFGLGNIFLSMMAWRSMLGDIGSKLPVPVAMRIFFIGQLGKYLPGSVWSVVAQADLGRDYQVPPRRTVAVSVVAMGVALASALMLAAFTLPFAAPDELVHYVWVVAILPVLIVGLMPSSVDRLTHLLLKLLRREPPDHEFTWQGVLRALLWYTASWLMIGLQIYTLAIGVHAHGARVLPLALGGGVLAFAAGFLAIFVPAGAVVREAVLVAVLSPVLSTDAAIVVAVVSRLIATLGDGLWAAVAAALARHRGVHPMAARKKALPAEAEHLPRVAP